MMKKVRIHILSVMAILLLAVLYSCNSNPCKSIVCLNNGTCREGACACVSGFEGAYCTSKLSDKFIGKYDGFVRVNGGVDTTYSIILAPGEDAKHIKIYFVDVYGSSSIFIGNISTTATTTFTIPTQQSTGTHSFTYTGNGYIEGGKYLHIFFEQTASGSSIQDYFYEGTKYVTP